MKKVVQHIGKNLMVELRLKKEYSDQWLVDNKDDLLQGAVVDTETTGTCPLEDEITELAIRPFLFHKNTYEVVKILPAFDQFQEPSDMSKLTEEIQEITNITPEMIRGESIDWEEANNICNNSVCLIAHNADFDKTMLSAHEGWTSTTEWYCSQNEVDWYEKGLPNRKQEILAPALCLVDEALAFDFEAHRAINDVDSLLQIIINLDLLEEIFEESVELQAQGFVSKRFYNMFWKRNRMYIRNKYENNKKTTYVAGTLKKSKVEKFKKFATTKAIREYQRDPQNKDKEPRLTWSEVPARKKY